MSRNVTRAFSYFRSSGEKEREGSSHSHSRRTSRGATVQSDSPRASADHLPPKLDSAAVSTAGDSHGKVQINGDAHAHELGNGHGRHELMNGDANAAHRGRTDSPVRSSAAAQDALAAISASVAAEAQAVLAVDKAASSSSTAANKTGSAAISRASSNAVNKADVGADTNRKSKSKGQPPSPVTQLNSIVEAERRWHDILEGHERKFSETMRSARLSWKDEVTELWQKQIRHEQDRAEKDKTTAAQLIREMKAAAAVAAAERLAAERRWQDKLDAQEHEAKETMEKAKREWGQQLERRELQATVEREASERRWQERFDEQLRVAKVEKMKAEGEIKTLMDEMRRVAAERAEAERRWQKLLKEMGTSGAASGSHSNK